MKKSATQTGSNDLLWNMPKYSSIWKAMWLNIRTRTLNITLYTPGIPVLWCNTLCDQKNIYYLYGQNTTIYFHTEEYIGYTTTSFGPVYWPSSGCTVNLTSSYTICAWGTPGGTRSRLTLVGGMVLNHYEPVLI